jgi:hypothetical protein
MQHQQGKEGVGIARAPAQLARDGAASDRQRAEQADVEHHAGAKVVVAQPLQHQIKKAWQHDAMLVVQRPEPAPGDGLVAREHRDHLPLVEEGDVDRIIEHEAEEQVGLRQPDEGDEEQGIAILGKRECSQHATLASALHQLAI